MSKVRAKKTEATAAYIWMESVALNGYRCPKCRRLLFREETNEIVMGNMNFVFSDGRHYGSCFCGHPAAIIVEDYEGPSKSENWEEHLNKVHAEETEALIKAGRAFENDRNRLKREVEQLNVVIRLRGEKITELSAKCNRLMSELDASRKTIAKLKEKTAALERQVERLQRKEV